MRHDQKMTVVHGILCLTSLLLILQLWLLTATMNAYMGGDRAVVWPAFWSSSGLLLFNLGLLRFVYHLDR